MAHIYSICDLRRLFVIIIIIMIEAYRAKHLLGYHSLTLILALPAKRIRYILAERCLCHANLLKYFIIFDVRTSRTIYRLLTLTTFFLYGSIDALCLFLDSNAIFPNNLIQIRS